MKVFSRLLYLHAPVKIADEKLFRVFKGVACLREYYEIFTIFV